MHELLRAVLSYSGAKHWLNWPGSPPNWLKGQQLMNRLIALNAMKASDEITEEQSRQVGPAPAISIRQARIAGYRLGLIIQMLFDIENAYNEFFRSLSGKSS